MSAEIIDLITGALSFLFTIMILSYVFGDNLFFRVAVYIFVGTAAGYIAAIAFWQVLWADLIYPLTQGNLVLFFPLLLIGLMLMKAWPRLTHLGAPAMAYLVGAGSAVAIGGAVFGTLSTQTAATVNAFDLRAAGATLFTPLNALIILIGLITTLAYFHFGGRASDDGSVKRFALIEWAAWAGRFFIAVALGVVFAGVYIAALTALVERFSALWDIL